MKYKLIIATWLAILPLCLFAQVQQVQSSYSSGNQSQNGNICVAGIPATTANNIKNTGYSTTIGFLAMEEDSTNTENTLPIANGGIDQAIISENEFTLDGSASFDPDNDVLTYLWTALDGITLKEATTKRPSFSTSEVKAIATYQFVLVVNDGELTSKPDTVSITITNPDWVPETATNSATFYGLVTFDGTNATEQDWVAAYIDGVNRGVSPIKIIENEPYAIFNIQADMEGEATFKLYDASTNQICEVEETTLIVPGFDIGTPTEPIILNGNCTNIDSPPTCNLTVDNQVICAGKNVIVQFECMFPDDYTYEWDFDSATIVSGQDLGPYELNWETAGTKTVSLLTYKNGNLTSTVSQIIEVLAVDLKEVAISICSGETYEFDGQSFTESTFYIGEFINQNGCDSLVLLNLMMSDATCQSPTTFSLSGNIVTEDLLSVKEVTIELDAMAEMTDNSNAEGDYQIDHIPYYTDSTYIIKPTKITNPLNGVTTYDLVLISKFILGLHEFDSPYQYIAADVNKSGTITAIDIVKLRQLMLAVTNEFPNNNVWRFVDANFEFPSIETTNPLTVDFPESITPNDLPIDSMGHNFIAVKIGDINGSVLMNNRVNNTASNNFQVNLTAQDITIGKTTIIPLTGTTNQLDGFQFTLQFDPNQIAIIDIKEQLLKKENIGIQQIEQGLISFSWIGAATTNELVELTVKGKTNTSTSKAFQIATQPLAPEAYTYTNQIEPIDLIFSSLKEESPMVLHQNEPNPFNVATIIRFDLPKGTTYQFVISDANGNVVQRISNRISIGLNEIKINSELLNSSGVYYYQLISGRQSMTKKLVLIE